MAIFATLKVSKDKLEINASIVGNFIFRPDDIVSIIPQAAFLTKGLRIVHRVATYKKRVIFWTFSDPTELLKRIEQTAFLDNSSPLPTSLEAEISDSRSKGGVPIKMSAIGVFAVAWNVFFMLDIKNLINRQRQSSVLGIGALLALAFAFATGFLILMFAPFRKGILKEGRTLNDIKAFVYLMMLISGLMILSISLIN